MYIIENIIKKTVDEKNKLSILIINQDNEDYIYNLSKLDHNFYIIQENGFNFNWKNDFMPNNLIFINTIGNFLFMH